MQSFFTNKKIVFVLLVGFILFSLYFLWIDTYHTVENYATKTLMTPPRESTEVTKWITTRMTKNSPKECSIKDTIEGISLILAAKIDVSDKMLYINFMFQHHPWKICAKHPKLCGLMNLLNHPSLTDEQKIEFMKRYIIYHYMLFSGKSEEDIITEVTQLNVKNAFDMNQDISKVIYTEKSNSDKIRELIQILTTNLYPIIITTEGMPICKG